MIFMFAYGLCSVQSYVIWLRINISTLYIYIYKFTMFLFTLFLQSFHKIMCNSNFNQLRLAHDNILSMFMFYQVYVYSEIWSVQISNMFSDKTHMLLYVYSRGLIINSWIKFMLWVLISNTVSISCDLPWIWQKGQVRSCQFGFRVWL